MGLFGMFKATEPSSPESPKREPKTPALMEIARIISNGDEVVLQAAASCVEDPQGWFQAHQDRYEARGVDSAGDVDLVQWRGLVDN